MPEEPVSISIPKAAAILGISPGHAYALNKEGKLPGAYRLGTRVLVHVPTLLREIEKAAAKPSEGT